VIDHLGRRYNVRHIFELARFFFPVSLVPRRWRRAALTFGSSPSGRAAICSTMIADAFERVGYPILPELVLIDAGAPGPWWKRWLGYDNGPPSARFRRANTAAITPRDFDLSPYFEVVKFNHLGDPRFDYRQIVWEDAPHAHNGNGAAAPSPEAGRGAVFSACGPLSSVARARPDHFLPPPRGVMSRSGGGVSGSFQRMYGFSFSSWYAFAMSMAEWNAASKAAKSFFSIAVSIGFQFSSRN
jgi:hypothetical protein